MDRLQILLVGLPLVLLTSDIWALFSAPPAQPTVSRHQHQQTSPVFKDPSSLLSDSQTLETVDTAESGARVHIFFCTSCSYRGNALTVKQMLENSFPGIDVGLSNYPPSLPKRVLSKLVPVLQVGTFVLVMAGDQIFPRLGYTTPPAWYFSLRQNRFGTIATTWLLSNLLQSFLQSTGAFEVYCNGDLVFSKLREHRFPGEYELRELINKCVGARDIIG